jgi:type II secretion system protein C
MRKPVFRAVIGVSIVVSAVSLGVMLTRYLGLRSYAPKAPPRAAPAATSREAAVDSPENWKNMFAPSDGMGTPSRLPAVGAGAAAAGGRSAYTLVGTIVSTRTGDSRAALWAEGMKEPKLFRINAEVEPGAVLVAVARDKVWLTRGNNREQLDLLPVGSKGRTAGPASPPPSGKAGGGRQSASPGDASAEANLRVERLGNNVFAIDEASVAQLAGNINQFMTHIRLVPYFEANQSAGYRIAAIRPGTAFDKLGFQGGDVLQQVNGVNLTSPEKMYTIFQNLKDEKQVTVDIIRQGQKNTLKYEIR